MFSTKVCMCAVYHMQTYPVSWQTGHNSASPSWTWWEEEYFINSLVCYPSSRHPGSFSSIIFNIYASSDVAYVGTSSKMGSLVHSVEYHAMMALDRTMSCIWPKLSISNYQYKLSSCGNNPINKMGQNASSIYKWELHWCISSSSNSAVKPIIYNAL